MNPLKPHDVVGKRITKVYFPERFWECVPVEVDVPASNLLFNFKMKLGAQTILVLDNYGNEDLPDSIEKRLFQVEKFSYTLGIDTETGMIYMVTFVEEQGVYCAVLVYFNLIADMMLPKSAILRLDELMSCKRPFAISIQQSFLLNFIDREIGYSELPHGVVLSLDFRPRLELTHHNLYRYVDEWKDVFP